MASSRPSRMLSELLLDRLSKGASLLSDEAASLVTRFILGQRDPEGVFVNKASAPDLYYLPFALSCCIALNATPEFTPIKHFLSGQRVNELDLVHLASLSRSWQAVRWLEWKKRLSLTTPDRFPIPHRWISIHTKRERLAFQWLWERNRPVDFPNHQLSSPYSLFIALGLSEATGFRPFSGSEAEALLMPFHVPGGGWSNLPDGSSASANATAAALCVTVLLWGQPLAEDIAALRLLQDHTGGFRATAGSPLPDLLSTATALFALYLCGVEPLYPAKPFISDHWCMDGGFCSTILDEETDSEYTFYGLLALGCSSSS